MEAKNACKIEGTAESSRRRPFGKTWRTTQSTLKGASRQMVKSMSEKQLEDFASGPRKGKPEHVRKT